MTPYDDMEQLLSEAPLATPPADDVELVRRRIASVRPSRLPFGRHHVTIGYAAAACLLVAGLSVATTALVMRTNGNVPRGDATSGPAPAPSVAPAASYAGPRLVIRTDFFSASARKRGNPHVDITKWSSQPIPQGKEK